MKSLQRFWKGENSSLNRAIDEPKALDAMIEIDRLVKGNRVFNRELVINIMKKHSLWEE